MKGVAREGRRKSCCDRLRVVQIVFVMTTSRSLAWGLALVAVSLGCETSEGAPPPPGGGTLGPATPVAQQPGGGLDGGVDGEVDGGVDGDLGGGTDGGVETTTGLTGFTGFDDGFVPPPLGGGGVTGLQESCFTVCDCPINQRCDRGRCTPDAFPTGRTVYCCDGPVCPTRERCQFPSGEFGVCR